MKLKSFLAALLIIPSLTGAADEAPKYKDSNLPIETRVDDLLSRMTLEEKIAQMRHIHGYMIVEEGKLSEEKLEKLLDNGGMGFVEALTLPGKDCRDLMSGVQDYMRRKTRLGIPVLTITESLHGSVHDGSTIFPQSVALGSTFNPDLAYAMTAAVSKELKAQGIKQSLTPVIDVCRDLRWGRVEECFSEDPFLITQMGVAQVKGYLEHGVSPMIKHFGAHGNPQGGLNLASVAIGKRELRSIYLYPFERVVKEAQPWAVMSSYNSWNNEPNSSSSYLLTDLLRDEWGFKGYVYSDWGAISMLNYFHHTAQNGAEAAMQALTAGLDAEASDNAYAELKQLVEYGALDVQYIDTAVRRILTTKFALGLFDNVEKKLSDKDYEKAVHTPEHIALARRIADESIILMKNDNHLLPLDTTRIKRIALVGPNADQVQFGDYTWSRSNSDGTTLREALIRSLPQGVSLQYAQGCDLVSKNKAGFEEAVRVASESDVTIVVVGSASASLARDYRNATCGEGFDLSDLTLTGVQQELVEAIHATGKPVVVVLLAGKPFAIPWIKEHVPAVVTQWYPGEQGGDALADMLLGRTNPSGKLNFSFPRSVGHLPCYYNYLPSDKGYYHSPGSEDKPGKDYVFSSPSSLWSFGHGLSYTNFEYLKVSTQKKDYSEADTILVSVTIRNTGSRDGMDVPQVYVRDVVSSVVRPVHELKGFKKTLLHKGETREVTIPIAVSDLALFDKQMHRVVEPGTYELQIGRASDDIRLRQTITVNQRQERIIPTLKDRQREVASEKVDVKRAPIVVTGVVRDVQANVLPGVRIKAGESETETNVNGAYRIQTYTTDTIVIESSKYKSERIPINGRKLINIRLQNR